jgi:hypothetical protein
MAGNSRDLGKPDNNQMLYCPIVHTLVITEEQRQLSLPGEVAIWWRCPACSGWHVALRPEVAPRLTVVGQQVFSPAI